ncbi:MAG: SH3 domain-containing protein, partial [Thermoguttaceae bacterium]|nr:SH3 domain-containing protein [Thermoguttaceae bacterium]
MNNIASRTTNRGCLYSLYCRLSLLLAGIVMFTSSAFAQIQEGFPYMAKVSVKNVAARSGPGVNYYPTQALPVGSVVEVYCELPTGWAAIRPPQGSFSWVRGKFLEVQTDGTGRITEDNAASGVGSELIDSRDVVQVRMRKDERVEVIQKTNIGSEEWYRISPPSGEFRWVNLNDILPDDPIRRTPQQTQRSQNPSSVAFSPITAPGTAFPPGQYGQPPAPGFRPPHGLSDEEFYRELTALESAWSAMFHTKPDTWRSAQLLQRARYLKTLANTPRKLERVDLLIARLEKANAMEIAAGVPQPGMPPRPYGAGAPANPLLDPKTLPAGARATV